MRTYAGILVAFLMASGGAHAEQTFDALMQKGDLNSVIKERTESALLEQSIAVEQARASAQSRSEYGIELRPRLTEDDVGVALRIYLPSRWDKSKLREQLVLVAEEEQLRVATLEWQELMGVYRAFCEYRMLNQQLDLYKKELKMLEPYLEQADEQVKLSQFAVVERSKLYSLYLDLVNDHEKIKTELLENQEGLFFLVGPNADLAKMAQTAHIEMPPQAEFEPLFQQALENRSDFRIHDVHARSTSAAAAMARSEDGFRLKYIQPDFRADHSNNDTTVGISASFILPWGTRNPDIAVYQHQQALSLSVMDLQRRLIADRLRVLLKTADAYYAQAADRATKLEPLLHTLNQDLKTIQTGRLEEVRDILLIRERMLDVSLQTTRTVFKKERIAVDLAQEIGTVVRYGLDE